MPPPGKPCMRSILPMGRSRVFVCLYSMIVLCASFISSGDCWRQEWTPNYVVTHEDLDKASLSRFEGEKSDVDHFKVLHSEADHILIGAKNRVHNISLATLKEVVDRKLEWAPRKSDKENCEKKLPTSIHSKCENYIRVLGKVNDSIYVCGTNAFKPKCRLYEYHSKEEANPPKTVIGYNPIKEDSGVGKCPYDPEHNSTSIYTGGKLYSATVADFHAKDPLIMESELESLLRIRTEQHDSNMLSDPSFVSSFEVDDKIYFFLRENAVENINCGKASFSRVARVCKQDQGGQFKKVWTSYFKARLNCSIPGDNPFAFDELQSTSDLQSGNYQAASDASKQKKMFYGVFNTPENSIWGSAICAFTYEDVVNAFQGRYKGQASAKHNWLSIAKDKTPDPHPNSCVEDSKQMGQKTLDFIHDHPLMDSTVLPAGGAPVVVQTDSKSRFTAIAVDWQFLAQRTYYDIMFIGTSDGRILKAINKGRDGQVSTTVIEDIQVLRKHEAVSELKIYRDENTEKLVVFSKKTIVSIPLHRCSKQTTCGNCLHLQDPYCAWHENQCTRTPHGLQDIHRGSDSKCPEGSKREDTKTRPTATEAPRKTCLPCITPSSDYNIQNSNKNSKNDSTGAISPPISPSREDEPEESTTDKQHTVKERCAPSSTHPDFKTYTASTLAIACVISVVVAILGGFMLGYKVSLCRNNSRDANQMINIEQNFGSLRKSPNRQHSIEAQRNIYNESPQGAKQQHKIQNNQKNILVSNNIAVKNPNLPNGSIESAIVTPKQASKTYL